VPLTYTDKDVKSYDGELWRILKTAGPHALRWDQLRHWGPHEGMRFEPHPAGAPQVHPEAAVLYAASDFYTAFAEVFSDAHTIDRDAQSPALVSWIPSRPLRLLDVTTRSITRIFGAAAIQMIQERPVTHAWARALYQQCQWPIRTAHWRGSSDWPLTNMHSAAAFHVVIMSSTSQLKMASIEDSTRSDPVRTAAKRVGPGASVEGRPRRIEN